MTPRLGSLFSGYGGLDLAVEEVLGARTVWVSDIEPGPCKILAHRLPGVPNLGDITAVDWARVEPVDVIAGGSPCPDLSVAGRGAGMRPGTRSGLWASMLDAVAALRPSYVIWENVRGAYSAPASSASDMVTGPGGVGDRPGRPALRALGRVLGDLADRGYDAAWCGLRAADVGAPHGRCRVFVLAWPAGTEGLGLGRPRDARAGRAGSAHDRGDAPDPLTLLPTPTATPYGRQRSASAGAVVRPSLDGVTRALLPTPEAADALGGRVSAEMGGVRPSGAKRAVTLATALQHLLPTPVASPTGRSAEDHLAMQQAMGRTGVTDLGAAVALLPTPTTEPMTGNGHARHLGGEIAALLPTPRATDGTKGGPHQRGSRGDLMLPSAVALLPTPRASAPDAPTSVSARQRYSSGDSLGDVIAAQAWGDYGQAIDRWAAVLGRPAPSPTEPTGKGGRPRLSPRFVEWMMGVPDGHVTAVPGVTRVEALRALGNGVVPQQAAAALCHLLAVRAVPRAVAA